MKRLFGLVLAGLFLLAVFSATAVAGGDSIRVMTQNQYLGADLTPFFTAQTPEEFNDAAEEALTQIALNNFRIRARRFATEVALTEPDVIGLQEVFDFKLNGQNRRPPFLDQLQETLDALAARGLRYEVAATVENFDLETFIDGIGLVRVLDRDIILVREGIAFTKLDGIFDPVAIDSDHNPLCGVPVPNPAYVPGGPLPDTLISTPSVDGCNYTIAVSVNSPLGSMTIERGFVGVDVTVRGKDYRVVNTHLEQMEPDPTIPASTLIQYLQAVELVGTLQVTTPEDRNLILLGDFNSSEDDSPIQLEPPDFPIEIHIIPPYQIIRRAGFADIWDTNRFAFFDPGYTCCQDNDLANRRSQLDERIDLIFVRDASFLSYAFVVGRVPIFPLFWPPNWASDHAGVFAKLIFRQDEMGWLYGRWSRRH